MEIKDEKEINKIIERARAAVKMAKGYERTTDFEAAKYTAKNAYDYYRQVGKDMRFMKEKAECEMLIAKLAHICNDLEDAVTYSFLAYKSYEKIVNQDSSQYQKLANVELWCAKLYERCEMHNSAIDSYANIIDLIVKHNNAQNVEDGKIVKDCLDGLWRIEKKYGYKHRLAVKAGEEFLEKSKENTK